MKALESTRGRLGFDVGFKAAQGIPRTRNLVNQLENQ